MQWMIDQLLDFSRARGSGGIALQRRPADAGAVMRDILDELCVAHPDAAIELEASGDLRGEWDAGRLAQVVTTLVGNAIQHGRGGVPIMLRFDGSFSVAIVLTIANGGTIGEELLPIIFAPFCAV